MTKDNPRVQVFCHFNASDAKHSDQSLPNHSYSRLSCTFSSPHSKPSSCSEFLLQLTLCIIYTWANCCAFATAQMRVLGRGEWQTRHSGRMRIMMMSSSTSRWCSKWASAWFSMALNSSRSNSSDSKSNSNNESCCQQMWHVAWFELKMLSQMCINLSENFAKYTHSPSGFPLSP